jgi:hypothetical protein
MWPVGIALGGVALIGMALDRRTTMRQWWLLACVPVLSAVAAALTPVGPELYVQELRVQTRAHFFSEWQSPYLANHACVTLLILLGMILIALLRRPWRGWVTVLLFLTAVGCAFWTWRTVPVAGAIAVPVGAPAVQGLIARKSAPPGPREIVGLAAACAVALAALGLAVPHRVPDPTRDPAWLQPALTALPPGTKVLSTWDTSAVLMWRFPDLDPVANGYGDTYTVPELQRSADVETLAPGWVAELREIGATVAVLPTGTDLERALERNQHWRVTHQASDMTMLVAPADWVTSG